LSRSLRYVLNRNEGIDTLHADPLEECNVDDAVGVESLDEATALKMKRGGFARLCKHCERHWPREEN
jgi:hypothetical protein